MVSKEIVDDEEIGDESPPQAGGGYRDDPWYLEFTEMVKHFSLSPFLIFSSYVLHL